METLENRLQKRIHISLYALLFLTTLLGLSVLLEGCTDRCEVTHEYTYFEPVYSTIQEVRAGVAILPPQNINTTGKIYFKDGFMYINEPGEGIHIINNHNPANPIPLNFIKIPGNYDLAIKGNTLYADSYVDLVMFDVSDAGNLREINRLENIFENYRVLDYASNGTSVITGFEEKKQIYINESDCNPSNIASWGGMTLEDGIAVRSDMLSLFSAKAAIAPGTGSGSGVGGSLARFTIAANHLYLLDGGDLRTIDVSVETDPVAKTRTQLSWDIETIFPYKSNLFIGSSSGMYILDISSPETPVFISNYQHMRSCDPVVVDDHYAYVTLRSGNFCQGFVNELQVIDISDLTAPKLVNTYPMVNPHGLGIDNQTLFICDGDDGLKVYNVSDVKKIAENQISHHQDIHALDVIPLNNVLMMLGRDGIVQYDYSNPADLKILSKISVSNE
jgi:hypothetical protein